MQFPRSTGFTTPPPLESIPLEIIFSSSNPEQTVPPSPSSVADSAVDMETSFIPEPSREITSSEISEIFSEPPPSPPPRRSTLMWEIANELMDLPVSYYNWDTDLAESMNMVAFDLMTADAQDFRARYRQIENDNTPEDYVVINMPTEEPQVEPATKGNTQLNESVTAMQDRCMWICIGVAGVAMLLFIIFVVLWVCLN